MIKIVCYDILSGVNTETYGPFESIQVTSAEVRDENDNKILHYDYSEECWFSMLTGNGWYDWTVESADS